MSVVSRSSLLEKRWDLKKKRWELLTWWKSLSSNGKVRPLYLLMSTWVFVCSHLEQICSDLLSVAERSFLQGNRYYSFTGNIFFPPCTCRVDLNRELFSRVWASQRQTLPFLWPRVPLSLSQSSHLCGQWLDYNLQGLELNSGEKPGVSQERLSNLSWLEDVLRSVDTPSSWTPSLLGTWEVWAPRLPKAPVPRCQWAQRSPNLKLSPKSHHLWVAKEVNSGESPVGLSAEHLPLSIL